MEEQENEIVEQEQDESTSNPWAAAFFVLLVIVIAGAVFVNRGALAGEKVSLSGTEKAQAIAIAEHRQKLGFQRQEAQNEFQAKFNRFQEEENAINVEAAKLCFELKKSHRLPPNANYWLNEWAGELEKRAVGQCLDCAGNGESDGPYYPQYGGHNDP